VSAQAGLRHMFKGLLIDFFLLLTVIRLEGMRLMRPERSWRPIVTVEIDEHNTHETTLGVDGQNINQKQTFNLCVLLICFSYFSQLLSLFFSLLQ
jgi:hypothetical protein